MRGRVAKAAVQSALTFKLYIGALELFGELCSLAKGFGPIFEGGLGRL